MSRFARRKDGNHHAIVTALVAHGASAEAIESGQPGVPDLLVGYLGETELLEVKDGKRVPSARRLNADQVAWHRQWRGRPVLVVKSVDEALAVLARIRGALTRSEVAS
jgi:hypothetical protein